jgi:hypothetical protein
VKKGRGGWLKALQEYRTYHRTTALRKHQTLSYSFHINVYGHPTTCFVPLVNVLRREDTNPVVLEIPETARSAMLYLFERILVVSQSNVHRWWYNLWKF